MKEIIYDILKSAVLFTFDVNMYLLFLYIYFNKNNINKNF